MAEKIHRKAARFGGKYTVIKNKNKIGTDIPENTVIEKSIWFAKPHDLSVSAEVQSAHLATLPNYISAY